MAYRKSGVDWLKAKQEFLATKGMTLKDIAEKYKITYSSVTKVAMNEKWSVEKERIWGEAEKEAIEETEGSIKDLIRRHSKVARFLQAASLSNLQIITQWLKNNPDAWKAAVSKAKLGDLARIIQALNGMAGEGLKGERELYPKQMQIKGDLSLEAENLTPAQKKAIYGQFKRGLIKPRGDAGGGDIKDNSK